MLDVNDNPPVFEKIDYSTSVLESDPIGTKIVTVFAASRDIGVNAEITYSIVGSVQEKFVIDKKKG